MPRARRIRRYDVLWAVHDALMRFMAFTAQKRSYMARIKTLYEGVRHAFPDRQEDDPELAEHMEPVLELAMQTDSAKLSEDFSTIGAKLELVQAGRVARNVGTEREGTEGYSRPTRVGLYSAS